MKDFSIGEFFSFIIPGSAVILGFSLAAPGLGRALLGDGISIGAAGTFILLAYIVGHMTQAVGEVTTREEALSYIRAHFLSKGVNVYG